MSEKMMKKSRVLIAALLGTMMVAALTIWGCGGGGTSSYTDPNTLISTTTKPTIIGADQLKTWINEGKLNASFGSKDRVVVVSPATATEWVSPEKGHIPGAVRWDSAKLSEDGRTEGLSISGSMMPSGTMMDGIIQDLGIDGNTTIVISLPKNGTLFYQSLIYWDLRYWGFPKERIKILNGGDDAWEVAQNSLSIDATEKYTKSTYSVAKNAGLKTVFRYNIGQVIAKVDETINTPAVLNDWQMIDVRGFLPQYITNARRMTGYTQFFKRLDAGDGVTRNYLYPSKAELIDPIDPTKGLFATSKVYVPGDVSGTPTGSLSATKKTIVMCAASSSASPSFVLFDAVLDVPEGNITMYDGSAYQWNAYTADQLAYKLLAGTAAAPKNYKNLTTQAQKDQILQWAFNNPDDPTKNRAQGITANPTASAAPLFPVPTTTRTVTSIGPPVVASETTTVALPSGFSWIAPSFVNGPSVTGMTDQIDQGNQAYIEFIKRNSIVNQNSGTGGSQQGC